MRPALTIVTAPASDPVTAQQLKDFMRVQTNIEDALIGSIGDAAWAVIEHYLERALVTQTWKQTMDYFPSVIKLGKNPVLSITHVKYYDTAGTFTTLTVTTDYVSYLAQEPARIVPAYEKCWPATRGGLPEQVEVQFVCGYGALTAVPPAILTAIKNLALYWYDNRSVALTEGTIPKGIKAMIASYRLKNFSED